MFHSFSSALQNDPVFCSQGEEIHLPAPAAAGQRRPPAEHPDGGVSAPRPPVPRPHPAAPQGHGPPAAAGAAGAGGLRREGRLRQRGGGGSGRGRDHPQEPGP